MCAIERTALSLLAFTWVLAKSSPAFAAGNEAVPTKPRPEEPRRKNFVLAVEGEASLRRFDDVEPKNQSTRSYQAFPVPGVFADAALYPVLHGHLGLEGAFSRSLGAESTTYDRQRLATTATVVDGMLKSRWFTAHRDDAPWITIGVGYRYFSFDFDGAPTDREVPSARYHILRAGADARVPIDRVTLFAGMNYERAASIGPLGATRAAGNGDGVDAQVGASFEIVRWFRVRAEVRYSWLTFALIREVPAVAVDQTVTAGAGAELAF